MSDQLRERYLEALIARAATDAGDAVLDRIERLLGISGAIEQPGIHRAEAEATTRTSADGEAGRSSTPDAASPIQQPSAGRAGTGQRGVSAAPVAGPVDPSAASCPECGHRAKNARGLAIHRSLRHGVVGVMHQRHAKKPPDRAQLAPDPAVFPDAPGTAWMDDGVMIVGDQAWTPDQWAGEWGKAYRARRNGHIEPVPIGEIKNGHPSASEKFLCGSCDQPFPTRQLRDEHQALNACARIPTRPPAKDEPFRITLPGSPVGQIAGLGE